MYPGFKDDVSLIRSQISDARAKNDIVIIYSLLFIGLFTGGLASIAGVVYAYVRKPYYIGQPQYKEYMDSIKVFWILFWISMIPFILIFVFIILPIVGTISLAAIFSIFNH